MPTGQEFLKTDDFAKDMFEHIGFPGGEVPDAVADLYMKVKSAKDKLHPGRMTPEGFAIIAALATPPIEEKKERDNKGKGQ